MSAHGPNAAARVFGVSRGTLLSIAVGAGRVNPATFALIRERFPLVSERIRQLSAAPAALSHVGGLEARR